jgi:hypothetical protein
MEKDIVLEIAAFNLKSPSKMYRHTVACLEEVNDEMLVNNFLILQWHC